MSYHYRKVPRRGDGCATLVNTIVFGVLAGSLAGIYIITRDSGAKIVQFLGFASLVSAIYVSICYIVFLIARHFGGLDEYKKK